ncbi:MAG: hypothetical protein WBF71_11785 [Microthrixaceae bacterium]
MEGSEFDQCGELWIKHADCDDRCLVVDVEVEPFEHDLVEGLALFVYASLIELVCWDCCRVCVTGVVLMVRGVEPWARKDHCYDFCIF